MAATLLGQLNTLDSTVTSRFSAVVKETHWLRLKPTTGRVLAIRTVPIKPATNTTFGYVTHCYVLLKTSGWNEGKWTLSATLALNSD
jgi:hypothetical protein